MDFNKHYALHGKHAFLSASKYSWVNYSSEKMEEVARKAAAVKRGTELHELASQLINLGVKLPRNNKTLNAYVNDAIGYRMTPEQVLYYSDRIFGTADAISFDKNLLRIHDLKTGVTPASFTQLEIYAALFCHEYGFKPGSISIELRIYQNDEVVTHIPETEQLIHIMDRMHSFDKIIANVQSEEG